MRPLNDKEAFDKIVDKYSKEDVYERVDEAKECYVWNWENEFDNIHEAYEEMGRGEAERQIVNELIVETNPVSFSLTLFEMLVEHYELDIC